MTLRYALEAVLKDDGLVVDSLRWLEPSDYPSSKAAFAAAVRLLHDGYNVQTVSLVRVVAVRRRWVVTVSR